ncbi:proline-rich extensin-like protein EPR1 [Teleopsis dalmanni]|uniref:proline-rich extensin-like protein EPR1 n=1 Tax=Teleopsis dalmanni TaxID=139649 RepID=UPI0018CDA959|nr:proline-rich extensin-like protein EPR1 [Teleopsis dalmanni]XP_037954857.1 proline-rich extensin-like protein EPR1 [Teleopsis dalmanni]
MFRFLVVTTLVAFAASQHYHQNPQTAAIISEQRYLSGDGKFGAAYEQEDGINFKEETDADGTRHGSYSYVDPTGQRRTISYTAGKHGFQAAGEHLPVAPPAPPQPIPQPGYAPQPQYQPPSHNAYRGGNNDYDDGSYDPRYNDPGFGQNQQPAYQPAPQPQYRPPAPTYNPPPQPAYNPPQQQYNHYQPQQQQPQQQQHYQHTTPNPHRFSPPGKLSLNRTPDGFTYSFNKV